MLDLEPEVTARLQAAEYYHKWLENSYPRRPNGRNTLEGNILEVRHGILSCSDSSAMVINGNTITFCAVKFEVVPSTPRAPDSGIIPNVTFCAGSTADIRPGPPGPMAQKLSAHMSDILNHCINTQSFSNFENSLSLILHIDIFIINNGGSIFTSIWAACIAALMSLKLPPIRLDSKAGMIYHGDSSAGKKLEWHHIPLPMCAAYLAHQNSILLEPDFDEESIFYPRYMTALFDERNGELLYYEVQDIPNTAFNAFIHTNEFLNRINYLKKLLLSQ